VDLNIRTPPSPLRGEISSEVDLRPTIKIPIYKHKTNPKRSKKNNPVVPTIKSDTHHGNFAFHPDIY